MNILFPKNVIASPLPLDGTGNVVRQSTEVAKPFLLLLDNFCQDHLMNLQQEIGTSNQKIVKSRTKMKIQCYSLQRARQLTISSFNLYCAYVIRNFLDDRQKM